MARRMVVLAVLAALGPTPGCLNTTGEMSPGDADVHAERGDAETLRPDDGDRDRGEGEVRDEGGEARDEGGEHGEAEAVDDGTAEGGTRCGDGVLDPDEECDDGAENSDDRPDACRTDCRLPWCGDCVRDTGEGCDPCIDSRCLEDCRLPTCGNGSLDPGEDCDDANTDDTDDCIGTCRDAACGDGHVWALHEECDGAEPRVCDTTCGSVGAQDCVDCVWSEECAPPDEVCDGEDDDCDTAPDNGFVCAAGLEAPCTTDCGSTGTGTCSSSCTPATAADCAPPAETCSGADDDCDTETDEGFDCVPGSVRSCTTSCGGPGGSHTCGEACTWGECVPPAETCTGMDDDCDTETDEGFDCAMGTLEGCTASCGSAGTRFCREGCAWGACEPLPEVCNAVDDDCDTATDEGFDCLSGATETCTSPCGTPGGTRTCGTGCAWGACVPPAETCNAVDDDCDARTDEDFDCARGATVPCTTSCGSTGSGPCSGTCTVPTGASCAVPPESCNAADDDCDGDTDEIYTCVRGDTRGCITSCGSSGTQPCGADCAWGPCAPPSETCSGRDDDCDGSTDEGFDCVQGTSGTCANACSVSGNRTCATDCTWGACCGTTEECSTSCATRCDDDCDGTTDEGCPPCNDTCAGALEIGAGGDFAGTTTGALDDNVQCAGGCGPGGRDVWFHFRLEREEVVLLSLQDGLTWNSVIDVARGDSCASLTGVACNDDSCGGGNRRSQWAGVLTAGNYYVAVDGCHGGDHGAFTLRFIHSPCPGATEVSDGDSIDGNTCTHGNDSGGCGGNYSDDDAYFAVFCPGTYTLAADDCDDGEPWPATVNIRRGSGGVCGSTELACHAPNCGAGIPARRSSSTATITGPDLVFVIQDGYALWNECGPYTLDVSW